VMDVALPALRLDPVLGKIVFGEIKNQRFGMVYANHGMKMLRH
jgi:hypothetical protein